MRQCAGNVKPMPGLALALKQRAGAAIKGESPIGTNMPSLFRFLFICAVLAGIVYGAMFALVLYVEPVERDVTIRVPAERINQ